LLIPAINLRMKHYSVMFETKIPMVKFWGTTHHLEMVNLCSRCNQTIEQENLGFMMFT
jgi:hypothetical protein